MTIVERTTQFTLSKRVISKSAKDVTEATIALLTPFEGTVHTITADNGKELAFHEFQVQRMQNIKSCTKGLI